MGYADTLFDLTGRVALITGGSRGLGREMAFAMAALRSRGPIQVRDTANVATSFPGFTGLAGMAGVRIADADLA